MRILRFFSLLFAALSAGLVLALALESFARTGSDAASTARRKTWDLATAVLDSGAMLLSLPLLLFGRHAGQDRKATMAGIAALGAADALWAAGACSTSDDVAPEVNEVGEVVAAAPESTGWELPVAARAILQIGALSALIIASQQQPEPTLRDALKPQAKRLRRKASKLAPKATDRVEEAIEHLQPVAQRFLHEVSRQAPSSAEDAKGKLSDLVEHAQPAIMHFLHEAADRAPSRDEAMDAAKDAASRLRGPRDDARDAVKDAASRVRSSRHDAREALKDAAKRARKEGRRAEHRGEKQARGWMQRVPLLHAS